MFTYPVLGVLPVERKRKEKTQAPTAQDFSPSYHIRASRRQGGQGPDQSDATIAGIQSTADKAVTTYVMSQLMPLVINQVATMLATINISKQ